MGKNGAGDGNRTHTASLEGWNSTIELHPRAWPCGRRQPWRSQAAPAKAEPQEKSGAVDEIRTRDIHLGKVALYH